MCHQCASLPWHAHTPQRRLPQLGPEQDNGTRRRPQAKQVHCSNEFAAVPNGCSRLGRVQSPRFPPTTVPPRLVWRTRRWCGPRAPSRSQPLGKAISTRDGREPGAHHTRRVNCPALLVPAVVGPGVAAATRLVSAAILRARRLAAALYGFQAPLSPGRYPVVSKLGSLDRDGAARNRRRDGACCARDPRARNGEISGSILGGNLTLRPARGPDRKFMSTLHMRLEPCLVRRRDRSMLSTDLTGTPRPSVVPR